MKLMRVGPLGAERPAMLDAAGVVRDLSAHVADLTPETMTLESLARLRELDPATLPEIEAGRIGCPIARAPTFHCIGLNYRKHAEETGNPIPKEPIVFLKAASALAGPDDPLVIPKDSTHTDWEVELGVVIGRSCEHVSEADALSVVAGWCTINDVSERDWQNNRGGTWSKGKSAPGFGRVGPWIVTPDEVADPQNLPLWLEIDGQIQQRSTTADMIFGVAEIISYLSRFCRLEPGDVIATGTPEGVGTGQTPKRFLKPGEVVRLGVEGLGEQRQTVVAWPG